MDILKSIEEDWTIDREGGVVVRDPGFSPDINVFPIPYIPDSIFEDFGNTFSTALPKPRSRRGFCW